MAYVDGFLIPVPKKNMAAYRKMSQKAGAIWMKHGALDYKECVGADLAPEGVTATFPKVLKAKADETVVFSWIVYASKADRDRIMKKVMSDPLMQAPDCPFDPKRMCVAGFDVIVDMAPAKPKKKAPPKKKAKKKSAR